MKVKNKIKQILSIIVTAMMMMSLFTVNAFAAPGNFESSKDKGSITVKKPSSVTGDSTAKYTAYKILNAEIVTGTNSIYKYTVATGFENLIGSGKTYELTDEGKIIKKGKPAEGETPAVPDVVINDPTSLDSSAQQEFARAVEAYINNTANNVQPYVVNEETNQTEFAIETKQTVALGYYAVLQTTTDSKFIQSLPIVVDVPHVTYNATAPNKFDYDFDIEIDAKIDGAPTVEKKIVEGENKENKLDENDVSIGDTVTYEITSTIPKYKEGSDLSKVSYYLTDTLSKGLTFGSVTSVVAKATGKADLTLATAQYDLTKTNNTNADNTITFSFNNNNVAEKFNTIKDYDSIVITYTATLNENAVIAGEGNPNKVKLTYTNNPATGNTTDTDEDIVKTYTYKVDVVKKDSVTTTKKLPGAKFELRKADGTTKIAEATTDDNGELTFSGLDAGTYTLVEVEAPEGYVLPTGDAAKTTFTVGAPATPDGTYEIKDVSGNNVLKDTNGNAVINNNTITITNAKGVNLPQTGGAGTWMFTIGGLVLMAGAVVVFMATRKKKAN